jgi:hypothetical protein
MGYSSNYKLFRLYKDLFNHIIIIIKSFYNVDSKSIQKFKNEDLFDFDQYNKLFDLVNDKTLNLQKDLLEKFKSSFQIIRSLFLQDVRSNGSVYFETLLSNLTPEKDNKQLEVGSHLNY